ncbi:2-amino-1-hydroxyethylphosphonate dioxygenase (glycine-forming)-like [Pecten maximus]|uniref:2-amino-1-hydroxyethylphosphonate dioxygenase (glycine-forming)-like n=1 Tax=Pecten maximus TaxID=6579 RepID=UPI00145897F8|nr:2-amino-1-hydroxyethylphosphonate dioxygenase (glycine-forming)-like [Pecten maximus]
MVEQVVSEVFRLYEERGSTGYLGERISKTDHSIQCAMLAEKEDQPVEVVLAAFLHDIGHLVGEDKGLENMASGDLNLGTRDHDVVGGQYLRDIGFPDKVCDIVQGHVQAKRYLVWKNQAYYDNLSPASRMTLEHQGGRMTDEQATDFENNPLFDVIIRMRTYDEAGKDVDATNAPLDKYRKLCKDYLSSMS